MNISRRNKAGELIYGQMKAIRYVRCGRSPGFPAIRAMRFSLIRDLKKSGISRNSRPVKGSAGMAGIHRMMSFSLRPRLFAARS